jgi:NAD(P)-dependent dehydrogenase (short-subunit alcohol dehydrogenase family)
MAPFYATAKHGVVGLVRSLAKPLGLEGIQINGLAPAVVGALNPSLFFFYCSLHFNWPVQHAETNIASDGDLFKHMIITPMSTVTRAVETLLTDSSLTGKIAELYEGNVTFAEQPDYADENVKKNIEMFWNLGYAWFINWHQLTWIGACIYELY